MFRVSYKKLNGSIGYIMEEPTTGSRSLVPRTYETEEAAKTAADTWNNYQNVSHVVSNFAVESAV